MYTNVKWSYCTVLYSGYTSTQERTLKNSTISLCYFNFVGIIHMIVTDINLPTRSLDTIISTWTCLQRRVNHILILSFGCSTENVKSTCHMTQTTATISTQHYPQHTRLSLLLLLCYSSYSSELASVTCDCVSMSESSRLWPWRNFAREDDTKDCLSLPKNSKSLLVNGKADVRHSWFLVRSSKEVRKSFSLWHLVFSVGCCSSVSSSSFLKSSWISPIRQQYWWKIPTSPPPRMCALGTQRR